MLVLLLPGAFPDMVHAICEYTLHAAINNQISGICTEQSCSAVRPELPVHLQLTRSYIHALMITFSCQQASYAGWDRRWDTRGLKLGCQIYATGGRQVPRAKGAF